MIRKHWLQSILLAFIFYQVIFTWIPVWIDAKKLEGVNVSTIQLQNEAGQLVPISEFKGKPLILNFWASWCGALPFGIAPVGANLPESG